VYFHLVTGAAPTTGSAREIVEAVSSRPRRRLRSLRPDLPAALDDALAAALSLDPRDRPASAGALMDGLAEALASAGSKHRLVRDARARIAARDEASPRSSCSSCLRPLNPRAQACSHCGESVS
jgi:hypothetical protein